MASANQQSQLYFSLSLLKQEGEEGFGEWHEAGHYWLWNASFPPEQGTGAVLQNRPEGIVQFNPQRYGLHHIPAGIAHQMSHVFGYWFSADADRLWICAPGKDRVYRALISGGMTGVHREGTFSWFCPQCAERLHSRQYPFSGLTSFRLAEKEVIQAFNRERSLRVCRKCGFEHPVAYGFSPREDGPQEGASRKTW